MHTHTRAHARTQSTPQGSRGRKKKTDEEKKLRSTSWKFYDTSRSGCNLTVYRMHRADLPVLQLLPTRTVLAHQTSPCSQIATRLPNLPSHPKNRVARFIVFQSKIRRAADCGVRKLKHAGAGLKVDAALLGCSEKHK